MNRWAILSALALIGSALLALNTPVLSTRASPANLGADDWITINKDYSSQRYVDLDQITPANVRSLKEICEIQLNEPVWFSSGILKVGRTLYASTFRATYAFDAATCDLHWRHVVDLKQPPASLNNRGPGYLDGKIFRGTGDGRLIALDANTGELLWDVQGADPGKHETFTSAPIAWQGNVFIGIAISDEGIAGRLMAFDVSTGKELWRFQTTLDDKFKFGGGFWTTYSLDPETGEVFGPVANPYPDFNRDLVPGDVAYTVYTDSVISVDAKKGRLNWHYQAVPRDEHDWDLATAPTLYRTLSGKDMVAIAGKSGRVYAIDRATRRRAFNTAGTTLENDQEPLNQDWKHVCPGLQGGTQFNGTAYHPGTGALYAGMGDHCAWFVKDKKFGANGGAVVKDWSSVAKLKAPKGWITAIDGETGAVLWKYQTDSQVQAGLVTTKSGLLFAGDMHGNLLVLDATAKNHPRLLNRIDVKGALNSGLISYSVGGEQYIAVAAGGPTENPTTVAGPLRVSIYGLHGGRKPKVVTVDRLEPSPLPGDITANQALYLQVCTNCHGPTGQGASAPPIARQSQLADAKLLKEFLETVPPPMPHLYPGVLEEKEVKMIAEYLEKKIFNCGPSEPQSCEPPGKPRTDGTKEWRAIYSVLTSPRCINCHPVSSSLPPLGGVYPQDYPRQADDRHPHYYGVVRGETEPFKTVETGVKVDIGIGAPFARCTSCHGNKNDPKTGIPGAEDPDHPGQPFWSLAPAPMAWESEPGIPLTGAKLCAHLKDKSLNGNRELKDTLHHLETEPLVNWAFNPGTRLNGEARTTPPISHEALVQEFQQWIDDGAPCPGDKS